jgi:hypothetical protein
METSTTLSNQLADGDERSHEQAVPALQHPGSLSPRYGLVLKSFVVSAMLTAKANST